jgi:hypothetical protein
MDHRDFVLWLKGYLDGRKLSDELIVIKEKLKEVKETYPRVQERVVNVTAPPQYVHQPKYDPVTPYKNPESPQ